MKFCFCIILTASIFIFLQCKQDSPSSAGNVVTPAQEWLTGRYELVEYSVLADIGGSESLLTQDDYATWDGALKLNNATANNQVLQLQQVITLNGEAAVREGSAFIDFDDDSGADLSSGAFQVNSISGDIIINADPDVDYRLTSMSFVSDGFALTLILEGTTQASVDYMETQVWHKISDLP